MLAAPGLITLTGLAPAHFHPIFRSKFRLWFTSSQRTRHALPRDMETVAKMTDKQSAPFEC
jgi:hypothetical protein